MDQIEQKIAEHEAKVYGVGKMPAQNKAVLRKQLERKDAFLDLYMDRDFVNGKDDGEPPMGARW